MVSSNSLNPTSHFELALLNAQQLDGTPVEKHKDYDQIIDYVSPSSILLGLSLIIAHNTRSTTYSPQRTSEPIGTSTVYSVVLQTNLSASVRSLAGPNTERPNPRDKLQPPSCQLRPLKSWIISALVTSVAHPPILEALQRSTTATAATPTLN